LEYGRGSRGLVVDALPIMVFDKLLEGTSVMCLCQRHRHVSPILGKLASNQSSLSSIAGFNGIGFRCHEY
jgi:hypothetical protein